MGSKTKQTRAIRNNKVKNSGRARKNKLASLGTTLSQEALFAPKKD